MADHPTDQMTFAIIVEQGKNNLSAYSPDLPGCVSTGRTVEETLANMKEAILFHLEGLAEDHRPIPASVTVATQLFTVPSDVAS